MIDSEWPLTFAMSLESDEAAVVFIQQRHGPTGDRHLLQITWLTIVLAWVLYENQACFWKFIAGSRSSNIFTGQVHYLPAGPHMFLKD